MNLRGDLDFRDSKRTGRRIPTAIADSMPFCSVTRSPFSNLSATSSDMVKRTVRLARRQSLGPSSHGLLSGHDFMGPLKKTPCAIKMSQGTTLVVPKRLRYNLGFNPSDNRKVEMN